MGSPLKPPRRMQPCQHLGFRTSDLQNYKMIHLCCFEPMLLLLLSRSVMSNSLRPHGLQASRLLCPQNSPRQEYWRGLPFPTPGDLPDPETEPTSPALQAVAGSLALSHMESPILHDITYMWNLKCSTNEPIYRRETDSEKTDLDLPRGKKGERGRTRSFKKWCWDNCI